MSKKKKKNKAPKVKRETLKDKCERTLRRIRGEEDVVADSIVPIVSKESVAHIHSNSISKEEMNYEFADFFTRAGLLQ